ncbi:hypothetical protein BKA65DRAFT_483148 [Rhexocercosporidium sp. MPI-PUGE-AT-0058]|nr:hypothetical protein BKA65DRAFT_483148 [Rhexocercosporidium sp. MPI-PUGE-AT-0058]
MPSFLDLPREIRDEIYTYCLVSPSGLIAPYILPRTPTLKVSRRQVKSSTQKQNQKQKQKQQLHLITSPLVFTLDDPIFQNPRVFLARYKSAYLSLSLPSTCRQIYNETTSLFWRSNTFYFDGLCESGRGLGVARTLKSMGQTASRLIESMTIQMPGLGAEYAALRKVLNTLCSRARLGRFKRLELVWGVEEVRGLMSAAAGLGGSSQVYYKMIGDLREGFEGERFERVVRVAACPVGGREYVGDDGGDEELYEEVVRCLHGVVGGKMVCGRVLKWENQAMVGDIL